VFIDQEGSDFSDRHIFSNRLHKDYNRLGGAAESFMEELLYARRTTKVRGR
jgi:hypothetical protein